MPTSPLWCLPVRPVPPTPGADPESARGGRGPVGVAGLRTAHGVLGYRLASGAEPGDPVELTLAPGLAEPPGGLWLSWQGRLNRLSTGNSRWVVQTSIPTAVATAVPVPPAATVPAAAAPTSSTPGTPNAPTVPATTTASASAEPSPGRQVVVDRSKVGSTHFVCRLERHGKIVDQ